MAEARLIVNVIHTSDDPQGAECEFRIWYGPDQQHLLHPPATAERSIR
jgi:nucleoside-diphosphate kinase